MAELINKKDAIQQIKSIPYSTQEEILFMSVAVSRLRKMPTVEGFDADKYEKLVLADMERKHSENQQLLSELKAVLPTTTESEIRAKAIDEFAEKLKWEFENSVGVSKRAVYFANAVVDQAAEQLKEE